MAAKKRFGRPLFKTPRNLKHIVQNSIYKGHIKVKRNPLIHWNCMTLASMSVDRESPRRPKADVTKSGSDDPHEDDRLVNLYATEFRYLPYNTRPYVTAENKENWRIDDNAATFNNAYLPDEMPFNHAGNDDSQYFTGSFTVADL